MSFLMTVQVGHKYDMEKIEGDTQEIKTLIEYQGPCLGATTEHSLQSSNNMMFSQALRLLSRLTNIPNNEPRRTRLVFH